MSKLVILGIDGFDALLIDKWKDLLPNLAGMYSDISEIISQSTTPPDSICAWASIFTGENPAEHGLVESIDYLSGKKAGKDADRSASFRGRTFWDIAGKNGKKVCIINPFMAYPSWETNGVMVSGPVFEGGVTSTYPDDIKDLYNFPPLGGIVDFPEENELAGFLDRTRKTTEDLADVSLKVYRDLNPDLFFLTFLTLDRVKHFFWRYTDEKDIYYPGDNQFKYAIRDFYVMLDGIVGKFRESLYEDTALMVISDHGHGRRCSKCLNLNEILRNKGFISTDGKGVSSALKKMVEKTKVFTLSALSRYDLEDWIYRLAKFIPNRKALKKSTYLIDKKKSPVMLSNLCGANPFGGLDITAETEVEYERLRTNIINELMNINEELGEGIVKWARKREEIYKGENLKRLPDILFELDGEYGVGLNMFTSAVTPNYTHKKISGGHTKEGVLLVSGGDESIVNIERPASVLGLRDYILKIVNCGPSVQRL